MKAASILVGLAGPHARGWADALPPHLRALVAVGTPPGVRPRVWVAPDGAALKVSKRVPILTWNEAEPPPWLERLLDALAAGAPGDEAVRYATATARAEPPTAEPPTAEPPPPGPESPTASPAAADRLLLVAFWSGDRRVRTALPPNTVAVLQVSIAVPGPDDDHGDDPVEVPREPGRDTVVLDVVASGTPWSRPQVQQVSVPTGDPTAASTSAAFTLTTPADGGVVDIQLDLLHRGRPLQRATVSAAVRAVPLPFDRVHVQTRNTTSGPGPLPARAIPEGAREAALDATGADLVNLATGARVPLIDAREILDGLGQLLSQVLGAEDAPERLDDPRAGRLLVDLARRGAQLRDLFAPLGLDDADEVSLTVLPGTTLVPLELVYAGPAPRRGARVCGHARGKPSSCHGPSVGVVCPLAFWGTSRAVCRAVLLEPGETRRPPGRLALAPALYAATNRADSGVRGDAARPSALVRATASRLAGADCVQVGNWRDWRRAVRDTRPGLLVLLAHAEDAPGEHFLEIGRRSLLSSVDLRPDDVSRGEGVAPLVVLIACATAQAGDALGSFHAAFAGRGAAAVVGTLGKLNGSQGARAASAVLGSLADAGASGTKTLGAALADARRDLLAAGLLVGLLLVSHGEVDTRVAGG